MPGPGPGEPGELDDPPCPDSAEGTRDLGGLYGSLRQQIPLFAAVGALSLLAGLIPFPHRHTNEVLVAGGLFVLFTVLAVVLPWQRLPFWSLAIVPVGFIAVVAVLRDTQGGSGSGLAALYFLPLVWLAFYGQRSHLVVGLSAVALALVLPVVVVGPPVYPTSDWRPAVVVVIGGALVGFSFLSLVTRERRHARDMAAQSRLAQQAARDADEAREQLDALLRAATETAVIGADRRGVITFFSTGAEHLLGLRADDVVGRRHLLDLADPDELERRRPAIARIVSGGRPTWGDTESSLWHYSAPGGGRRTLSAVVTARSRHPEDGFVIVASDVTDREELAAGRERLLAVQHEVTQVLVEQNRNLRELTTMKDDIVATVSHEIRTPLTSIAGFTELLLDTAGPSLDPDQLQMLRTIARNADQLLKVAGDLLEDPGQHLGQRSRFTQVDLAGLAREAAESFWASTGGRDVTLQVEADGAVAVVGEASRLEQLLGNLLTNAVKFAPVGGRVRVSVSRIGDFARLEVSDNGPGIPPAERQFLFERFYRLASTVEKGVPGTGLGLAIVKSVADAHNGTVQVVDVPGWATTFRVHLPAAEATVHPAPATSPHSLFPPTPALTPSEQ